MPINVEEIRAQARVASITVSHIVHSGRRDQAFVSLTLKSPDEEGWTLEEAHIAHKLVSKDVVGMAYMDALARGHKNKNQVRNELEKRRRNYDQLVAGLERKFNKAVEAAAK